VDDRSHVRSSVVASQIDVHRAFGGVVPEIAARRHIEAIDVVISVPSSPALPGAIPNTAEWPCRAR